jgi:hypothetical protein
MREAIDASAPISTKWKFDLTTFQITWIALLLLVLIALLLTGTWINGRALGVLVDPGNRMSLSRLQLILWTWLLLSALSALALTFTSMSIYVPPQVWALMGISVGSTAASVIVKGTKANQEPAPALLQGLPAISRRGLLRTNPAVKDASLADLFSGDELTDAGYVDIAKVQMFFFTVATVLGYAYALWHFPFGSDHAPLVFPDLSESLVVLLGISHAGYLTVKAAPKTPTI